MKIQSTIITALLLSLDLAGCTQQLPGSFRLAQLTETFGSQQNFNTKIDLLWVVDNSASMDVSQEKLRNGFAGFANTYMQPTWDIRVAVITTDAYLANPAFSTYLNTTIPGTTGWKSTYINTRLSTWNNPTWNPSLINKYTGVFDSGVKFKELVPAWNSTYAQLLPGTHDGPIGALCSEILPYFLNGMSLCGNRDSHTANTGTANCLNPNVGAGESSVSQCVNTVQNDTVHSGKAIISTLLPAGQNAAAWTQQLINNFTINVTTGSAGSGSERGLASIQELLNDNEGTANAFFRPGSVRGVIIVSDEEDQSMTLPATPPAGFNPFSNYACDQASLLTKNSASSITGVNGYCCSTPGNNCTFGALGTSCAPKTVDGYTYTIGICPIASNLTPVSTFKTNLDNFFLNLDSNTSTDPGYFVAAIVPLTGASIQALQTTRNQDDINAGSIKYAAVDRGDRYLSLVSQVGNGSLGLDIAATDYSPILNSIGQAIIAKRSTFILSRAPTGSEDMIVSIIHGNGGGQSVIPSTDFTISGTSLKITDYNLILSLSSTDVININYQPKSVN